MPPAARQGDKAAFSCFFAALADKRMALHDGTRIVCLLPRFGPVNQAEAVRFIVKDMIL